MLRAMRNDFKKYSWTLWLVMIAFVGGFLLTDAFSGKSIEKSGLIYVNDQLMIRGEEYQRQLMRTLENYKNQFKNNFNRNLINQFRIPEQILQSLYSVALIRTEAERLKLSASDEELKQKIINYPAFQKDGKFVGLANYKRMLAYSRMEVSNFEDQLRDEVIREKFQNLITGALVMDNDTLKEKFKNEKDKAELDYIQLRTERIKEEIKIDENDPQIKAYYDAHKEDFKSKEKRGGYIIVYKFDDFKKEIKVDLMDQRNYFRDNQSDYIVPGKTKISRILLNYDAKNREEIFKKITALKAELTAENFAAKAKEFSQDNRAEQGGDHGYAGWQRFTAQETTFIKDLKQGDMSSPIDTQSGFSIVYATERVETTKQNFDDVKDKIKDTLETEKVTALVNEKLQKIYAKVEKAEDLKAKAEEMKLTVIDTGMLANGTPIKDFDEIGYISRALFSMKEKDVKFPVQFAKGMAIAQLTKIEKPQIEAFEAVIAQAKAKVVSAKKLDMLMNDAKNFASKLNTMTDEKKTEEYLKTNNLNKDFVTYKLGNKLGNFPAQEGMDNIVFNAPEKQFSAPVKFDSAVVIFKVKNKTITNDTDFAKEKTEFYTQKVNEIKNSYFSSYMANRMKNYKVTINQKLYEEIKEQILARYNN
jgi:peptidyl-prolyl cis-trans isomerase D